MWWDGGGGERERKKKYLGSTYSLCINVHVYKRSTIFLERTRKGHRQSNQHWNCFKGNIGDTPERRCGAHMGFPERIDTILNWTELNWTELNWPYLSATAHIICRQAGRLAKRKFYTCDTVRLTVDKRVNLRADWLGPSLVWRTPISKWMTVWFSRLPGLNHR